MVAEEHGIELSSVKSDVYTLIGLDSKVSTLASRIFCLTGVAEGAMHLPV